MKESRRARLNPIAENSDPCKKVSGVFSSRETIIAYRAHTHTRHRCTTDVRRLRCGFRLPPPAPPSVLLEVPYERRRRRRPTRTRTPQRDPTAQTHTPSSRAPARLTLHVRRGYVRFVLRRVSPSTRPPSHTRATPASSMGDSGCGSCTDATGFLSFTVRTQSVFVHQNHVLNTAKRIGTDAYGAPTHYIV